MKQKMMIPDFDHHVRNHQMGPMHVFVNHANHE